MGPLATATGIFSLGAACGAGLLLLLQRSGRSCSKHGTTARFVGRPHPSWQPGQPQPPPYGAGAPMLTLDPSAVDKASMYAFVISSVVPRPVAFVSTVSADGEGNLAPYSYFNVMGHNPPVVAIGMSRSPGRGGGKKDTFLNIEQTGEFVVNIMSDWFVEAANHTCGDFARGVDEMAAAGLTPQPSERVRPPRVAEAAVQFECKIRTVHEVLDRDGKPSNAIVIGEVVLVHVAEAVTGRSPSGKVVVDPGKLRAVCRLGGVTYGRVTELYDIPRPPNSSDPRDGGYLDPRK